MKTSSNFISTFFFYLTAFWGFQIYNERLEFFSGIIMMSIAMLIGMALQSGHEKSVQTKRDEFAKEVFQKIHNKDLDQGIPEYLLYLRPFNTTSNLSIYNTGFVDSTGGAGAMLPGAYQHKYFDMETRIADSLAGEEALISLGEPGEAFGAGRYLTDENNWKVVVSKFIDNAKHIFVIAGPQEGTIWEIEQILSRGYLPKTTFLTAPKPQSDSSAFDWKEYKLTLSEEFSKMELPLPELLEEGSFFRLDENKKIKKVISVPNASQSDKKLKKVLLTILNKSNSFIGEPAKNIRKLFDIILLIVISFVLYVLFTKSGLVS